MLHSNLSTLVIFTHLYLCSSPIPFDWEKFLITKLNADGHLFKTLMSFVAFSVSNIRRAQLLEIGCEERSNFFTIFDKYSFLIFQMGIHELGVRRAIVSSIENYLQAQQRAAEKAAALEKPYEGPSAPPVEYEKKPWEDAGAGASAPPLAGEMPGASYVPVKSDVTVRVNTECVVCLEREVS